MRGWIQFGSTSPLYAHLVEVVASDQELMDVLNRIEHLPRPNLLFAAVQYLMMEEGAGDLEPHYPNFGSGESRVDGVEGPFKDFVLSHADVIIEIGRTRHTQTNECRRCAVLLPAIWETTLASFHLVDIGTSAGLNLQLDRYRYQWGSTTWGPEASPVRLEAESRGRAFDPREIEIRSRTGLDLEPVDASDVEQTRWLEALVWPEHTDRRQRLRSALSMVATSSLHLVKGDARETLGEVLSQLSDGPALVMHSFSFNQNDDSWRLHLTEILERARASRDIYEVSLEAIAVSDGVARLDLDTGLYSRRLGVAQPHGEWLELYARP